MLARSVKITILFLGSPLRLEVDLPVCSIHFCYQLATALVKSVKTETMTFRYLQDQIFTKAFEPRCENTNILVFDQVLHKTRLHSHRRLLEARNLAFRK